MSNTCKQCGKQSLFKFCNTKCKTIWHNRNRVLKPNVFFNCKICGKRVEKWVAPSRQRSGVDTMEYCGRTCAGIGRTGENHPNWNGGKRVDKDGYIEILCRDHPMANSSGYVREHRIVMEKHIGRYLTQSEVVHHKNGNVQDNRIENLHLYESNSDHKREDYKERVIDELGRFLPKGIQ